MKIIDRDEQRCVHMGELLPKALVIVGDGTDNELLHEEGLEQADAFVAITGIEPRHILMAMSAARQTSNCKVVAKINRKSLMDLVSNESMIDSVVSAGSVTTELNFAVCQGYGECLRYQTEDSAPDRGGKGGGHGVHRHGGSAHLSTFL